MIKILVDHNMEGQAILLWDAYSKTGLAELYPTEFVMFDDIDLEINMTDREVWRFIQENRMLLLTDNRSDNDEDSLEETIREENMFTSLPVLTVGKISRIKEKSYREQCAERIAEIVSELDNYLGTGRIFIP